MDNLHQLTAIQPVQAACDASVDDRIAGSAIRVRIHPLMAIRTVNLATQIAAPRRQLNQGGILGKLKRLDNVLKHLHGDQHAPAFNATLHENVCDGSMHQRNFAQWAVLLGSRADFRFSICDFRAVGIMAAFAARGLIRVQGHATGRTIHDRFSFLRGGRALGKILVG
jgi:hypothetical protein